jgi:hypothetical protein
MLTRSKKRSIEENSFRQLEAVKHAKQNRNNACRDLLTIMNYQVANVPAIMDESGRVVAIYSDQIDQDYSDWLFFTTKFLDDIYTEAYG